MKRTLLICEKYPLPELFGGGMRTMNFVRFFMKFSDVDIAYQTPSLMMNKEDTPFSKEYVISKNRLPNGYGEHFSRFIAGMPYPITEYSDESHRLLLSLIYSKTYDYILFRHFRTAGNLIKMRSEHRRRIILDFDDVLSDSLYSIYFYPTKNLGRKSLRFLNEKLLMNYERRCLQFGACLFCSKKDSQKITVQRNENTFIVPNIYDDQPFKFYDFGEGFDRRHDLLFLGSLDYEPNLEGLKWFLNAVYEMFRTIHPDAKLMAVGKDPSEDMINLLRNRDGVELHANVPDIKEYYKKCRAVVVPILKGGGTRIKILEAALAKRPVLSTRVGAEGLDLTEGNEILLFEDGREFCSKYEELDDKKRYTSIVEKAKETVSLKYSKKVFEDSMRSVMGYLES